MQLTLDQLKAKVASQKTNLPALYGDVDFGIKPERFADELELEGPSQSKFDPMRPSCSPTPRRWSACAPTPCSATPWPTPMPR